MRNIYVRLDEPTIEALRELAQRELRDTKAQAAVLIREGLRRARRRDGELDTARQPRPGR